MADIGDQIGDIGGAIRAMFGLTRPNRLRDQIRGTLELYEMAARNQALVHASENLATLIDEETGKLLEASRSDRHQWNWAAWFMSWVIAGAAGAIAYLLVAPHWGTWWGDLLMVALGIVGALFFVAGLGVLLQREKDAV